MAVTEAQARRALRRVNIEWDEKVKDPRQAHNQRHEHHGLLSVFAAAFACGRTCLRRVEDFAADLGPSLRKRLWMPGGVSDTTLYRLLSKQGVSGLRETAWKKVRELIQGKLIRRDLFKLGVLSLDGKSLWASSRTTVEGAKTANDKKHGVITSTLMSLRAVLTSSRLRPCLDAEIIGKGTGESPAFRKVFPRAVEQFGGQFEIVTTDAGMTCSENAALVVGAKKHYLFALRANLHRLFELVSSMLEHAQLRTYREENRDGTRIRRELYVLTVNDIAELNFPGIQQVWKVRQTVTRDDKVLSDHVRYFVSSIPPLLLAPKDQLALVRLHWGIENGHNWTMDVALQEDDRQPCQSTQDAIEVVGWLRIIGYNLLSAWRAQLPPKDGRPTSWARCMELLRDAFVSNREGLFATLE